MKLKDLEVARKLETLIALGFPTVKMAELMAENPQNYNLLDGDMIGNFLKFFVIGMIPMTIDRTLANRLELSTEEYKQVKELYNKLISNLAEFFKNQNLIHPIEIFVVYKYMYQKGYLSYNHNFEYDKETKDMPKLYGADVVAGSGVCRHITSVLTDLYREMGYKSTNLTVHINSNLETGKNYKLDKSNKFVKFKNNIKNIFSHADHLITLVEYENQAYIFDPTNNFVLSKTQGNNLTLPKTKEELMKIKKRVYSVVKFLGYQDLISTKELKTMLEKSILDYDQYRSMYANTLVYTSNNNKIFEEFYEENCVLYLKLFDKLNKIPVLEQRRCYKMAFKK